MNKKTRLIEQIIQELIEERKEVTRDTVSAKAFNPRYQSLRPADISRYFRERDMTN